MRGKDFATLTYDDEAGITPAYAGKRFLLFLVAFLIRDHPRVCGEKNQLRLAFQVQKGSPPRMRGKAQTASLEGFQPGITPAYAGKSWRYF